MFPPSPVSGVRRRARTRARARRAVPAWSAAGCAALLGKARGADGGSRPQRVVARDVHRRSRANPAGRPPLTREDVQQLADLALTSDRVRQPQVRPEGVVVAPPVALAREVARRLELDDDAVRRALGDPGAIADLAQGAPGVVGDAQQYLAMVCQ